MAHCPKCKSENIRHSRTRNRWERWRKEITGKRPYRCRACGWRGWMAIGPSEQDRAGSRDPPMAPDPPNLTGTLLARPNPRRQMDLKELDRFHSLSEKDDA